MGSGSLFLWIFFNLGIIRKPEVEESMGFLFTAAMGKPFTMALGIQATISNIAAGRAYRVLRVVVAQVELEKDGVWGRLVSLK